MMTPETDPLVEAMRWHVESYTFKTPEEFEAAYARWRSATEGRPWLAPGTRNHAVTEDGICREERDDADDIKVDNNNVALLKRLVEGRTIVKFSRADDDGESWPQGATPVQIELDDGSRLLFDGWGYDAWGLNTAYRPRDAKKAPPDAG